MHVLNPAELEGLRKAVRFALDSNLCCAPGPDARAWFTGVLLVLAELPETDQVRAELLLVPEYHAAIRRACQG